MSRSLYLSVFFCLLLLLQSCGNLHDQAYALFLKGLYSGSVPLISPEELQKKKTQTTQLVLLDTRSEKEYRVSHLKGARFVDYAQFDVRQLQDIHKHTPIVVYCSVGYRSEQVGENLQAAGYTDVQNLYGGLFEWVNQGKPVYAAHGKTNKVHGHSRSWGIWLRKGEKVYE
ncbi:rhodanese-like domain-containing protein [uncultured Pontibacter sp.]|uniref:rhodanese-like domain-containing protein n=1 Tax=uncultured Pontibacter sp. TaxID=453356 RepID=UPI00261160BD|nr:rhodanese-like domain-containing protein [uncultured Pontibacter sp.]